MSRLTIFGLPATRYLTWQSIIIHMGVKMKKDALAFLGKTLLYIEPSSASARAEHRGDIFHCCLCFLS